MAPDRVRRRRDPAWDAEAVRRLRRHLRLTQREFADTLNARQQTVSEWETDRYRPRGPSARLLTYIAEEADFTYVAGPPRADSAASAAPREEQRSDEGAGGARGH